MFVFIAYYGVNLWKHNIKENYNVDPEIFIRDFIKNTNFLPAIKKYTPSLLDEIQGISDGSGIDYSTIYTFQLVDEVWLNASDILGEHCTSLGIQKKGKIPSVIAQNMDLEGFRNGFQTVLHIKHENSDLVAVNFTDMTDDECHKSLFEANKKLLRNYFKNKCENVIKEAEDLYLKHNKFSSFSLRIP